MLVFAAVVLFIGAVFNLIAWPRFFQRVAKDTRARTPSGRPTTFYRVHLVLLVVAMAITLASVVAGILLLGRSAPARLRTRPRHGREARGGAATGLPSMSRTGGRRPRGGVDRSASTHPIGGHDDRRDTTQYPQGVPSWIRGRFPDPDAAADFDARVVRLAVRGAAAAVGARVLPDRQRRRPRVGAIGLEPTASAAQGDHHVDDVDVDRARASTSAHAMDTDWTPAPEDGCWGAECVDPRACDVRARAGARPPGRSNQRSRGLGAERRRSDQTRCGSVVRRRLCARERSSARQGRARRSCSPGTAMTSRRRRPGDPRTAGRRAGGVRRRRRGARLVERGGRTRYVTFGVEDCARQETPGRRRSEDVCSRRGRDPTRAAEVATRRAHVPGGSQYTRDARRRGRCQASRSRRAPGAPGPGATPAPRRLVGRVEQHAQVPPA